MNEEQFERLLQSFEAIAEALGDLSVIQKRRYDRDYPERKGPREAVVSRIKTEEDLVKEQQGAGTGPLAEWLGGYEDPEFVGVRERAFLDEQAQQQHASAKTAGVSGKNPASPEAARSKSGGTKKLPADHPSPQKS